VDQDALSWANPWSIQAILRQGFGTQRRIDIHSSLKHHHSSRGLPVRPKPLPVVAFASERNDYPLVLLANQSHTTYHVMKKVLRFTGRFLAVLLLIVAILVGIYFAYPNKVEAYVYDAFYPKLRQVDKYRGQFTAEVPAVYELMWIACSLTEAFRTDDNVLNREGLHADYLRAVEDHFGGDADHPLVQKLDAYLTPKQYGLNHYAIRFLSLNYELDDKGRLQKTGDYRVPKLLTVLFRRQAFLIPENVRLINRFIQDTDFLSFYQEHQSYYAKLEANYPQIVDFEDMFEWLEARYPNTVESYRVIFSPLTGGFHNTMPLEGLEKGYQQNLMFVSAPLPNVPAPDSAGYALRGRLGRVVFTEIDHNYVNPFTDRHLEDLKKAMPDWRKWNTGKWGYESSYSTFLEYMTFGMYVLYVWDTFPAEYRRQVIADVEDMMGDYRNFVQFPAFSEVLLANYQSLEDPTDMDLLYRLTFEWMESIESGLSVALSE